MTTRERLTFGYSALAMTIVAAVALTFSSACDNSKPTQTASKQPAAASDEVAAKGVFSDAETSPTQVQPAAKVEWNRDYSP